MLKSVLAVITLIALIGCSGDQSEKYLQAGSAYFQQQDYDRAIENYEKAIALGTKSPVAYNMLGLSYRFKFQQTGKPELQQNEIDAFQKAINLDPKYGEAMVNLGTTYYARGDKAQAKAWFKKAQALKPGHPDKAEIDKTIAERAKASEVLKPDEKLAPPSLLESRNAAEVEKYLQQGGAYLQKEEYDQAIKSYKKAIELDPKNALAHNMLEMAYRLKYTQSTQNSGKTKSRPSRRARQ